jgi:hypothetical protein
MEIPDFDRIRFVTRHFHDLQGLRHWVPVGLVTLSVAGFASASRPLALLGAVTLLGALLLLLGAGRYYRNTFGTVDPQPVQPVAQVASVSIYRPAGPTPRLASFPPVIPRTPRTVLLLGMAPALFILFQLLLGPPWVRLQSGALLWSPILMSWPPLSIFFAQMISILSGSFFLGFWFLRECRLSQSYHLGLGALLLALPAFGATSLGLILLLCASSLVVAGLLDHWQLVRALGQTNSQEKES